MMVFSCIEIHNEQVASFDLVEVIKFKQSLEISYYDLLRRFDVDVDKTANKPTKIISI